MRSQVDLDRGGVATQAERVSIGPTVGWAWKHADRIWRVRQDGVIRIERGVTLVALEDPAANVTVQLPSARGLARAVAIPGTWVTAPVTVLDLTGHASERTFTIFPWPGEKISGLDSISLDTDWASVRLVPRLREGGWTVQI